MKKGMQKIKFDKLSWNQIDISPKNLLNWFLKECLLFRHNDWEARTKCQLMEKARIFYSLRLPYFSIQIISSLLDLGNISTYFFLWWGSNQDSWITHITSTKNGPGAMTTYRPNGDTEFIANFSLTGVCSINNVFRSDALWFWFESSGATSFKILDGPPLKQMNNSLYIYRP